MSKAKLNKTFFHKLFLLFIILLLPLFLIKEYRIIKAKKDTQVFVAEDFFQSQLEENNNKHFTFLLLTHNQAELIEENFHSIVNQKYPHFDLIYIDRGSTDKTAQKLNGLTKHYAAKKVQVIETKKDHEAFQAYFDVINALESDEVVIHLSPTDVLVHDEVLNLIDQAYTNPDVWMTYGQYFDYYNYQKGIYTPKPNKTLCKKRVQRAPWLLASLKTFYAGHFKKIRMKEDLEGYFLSFESEAALLRPLAEMGKAHVQFIPDVLYLHHAEGKSDRKKIQLSSLPMKNTEKLCHSLPMHQESADLILFSDHSPERLEKCLESIEKRVKGIGQISVLYQADDVSSYKAVSKRFPFVSFVSLDTPDQFKMAFFSSLSNGGGVSPYVVLSSDDVVVKEEVVLTPCIEAMRKSSAYGFYFHLGALSSLQTQEAIFSWMIEKGKEQWREPNKLKMALYRKVDLERDFRTVSLRSKEDLIRFWEKNEGRYLGLSFDHSKIDEN